MTRWIYTPKTTMFAHGNPNLIPNQKQHNHLFTVLKKLKKNNNKKIKILKQVVVLD